MTCEKAVARMDSFTTRLRAVAVWTVRTLILCLYVYGRHNYNTGLVL